MVDVPKIRLDNFLVERKYYTSRSRARDAVIRGCVQIDGVDIRKPGTMVGAGVNITISDKAHNYVSRAALKLIEGLRVTEFDPAGKTALDIGASTGGFTQVLLEHAATHVFAVDVGHGQLHESLRDDNRVTNLENCNARYLTVGDLNDTVPSFIVSDVSFISLRLALPRALELARTETQGIFLIKPQFELGPDKVGKGGLIKDIAAVENCAQEMCIWLNEQPGWRCTCLVPSPIKGSDGNLEFLMAGEKA